MAIFTFVIGYNSQNGETSPTKTYQSEEPAITPSETDVPETEINTNSNESSNDLFPNIEKGTQENSFQME